MYNVFLNSCTSLLIEDWANGRLLVIYKIILYQSTNKFIHKLGKLEIELTCDYKEDGITM